MHINHSKNVKINYACNFCYLLAFSMQWTQEWTRKLHTQLKCPKAFYSEKNFPLIYVHVWICLLKAINHLWNCLHFFVSFFWKLKLLMVFFLDSRQELPLCAARNPGSGIFDIEVLNVDEEILKLYSGLCWIEFYKIQLIYFFAFLKILLHASKIRFDFTLV